MTALNCESEITWFDLTLHVVRYLIINHLIEILHNLTAPVFVWQDYLYNAI